MRYTTEFEGETIEIDRFAAVALRIIGAVISVQGRPVVRGFSVTEQLCLAAKLQERYDEMDQDAVRIVRGIIEACCEPKGEKRPRHLRLVLSNDSDAHTGPQAGV